MSMRVKIYVRPTGNDSTGDGTLTSPYRTLQRALRAVPVIDPGDMRFVIDNTGCVEANPVAFPPFISGQVQAWDLGTDFAPYFAEGYVTLQAIPKQLDTLNDPTTSSALDPVSGLAMVQDTAKAWAVDQFKGKWLVGSGVMELAAIAGNTSNTLDTAYPFYSPFTTPVRIVDYAAELSGGVIVSGVSAPIVFNGQRVVQPGAYANGLRVTGCQEFIAALCELKDPWVTGCGDALLFTYIHGEGATNFTDVVFDNVFGNLWGYIADCSPGMGLFTGIQGIIENCAMPFGLTGQFGFCECRKTPFIFGMDAAGAILGGNIEVYHLKVNNVPGDAVIASGPGALLLYSVGAGPKVGGVGLHASNGAQVHVFNNVNPTGAGGDLKVGQNPMRTWSDFRNNAPKKNEIDQTPGTGDGSRVWE
jgi:hypothetical protein